eukprot:m.182229 g.182229  ORF g.182229 m.182229 type:complete len:607 (-) comp32103_c0_seq1:66-1886(-)
MPNPSEPTKEVPPQVTQPPPTLPTSADDSIISQAAPGFEVSTSKVPPLMGIDDNLLQSKEDRDDMEQDPPALANNTTASISGVRSLTTPNTKEVDQGKQSPRNNQGSGEDGDTMDTTACSISTLPGVSPIAHSHCKSASTGTKLSAASPPTLSTTHVTIDIAKKTEEEQRHHKEEETEKNNDHPISNMSEGLVSVGAVISETREVALETTQNEEDPPLGVARARTSTRKRSISVKMAESNLNVLRGSQLKVTDSALDKLLASTVTNETAQPRAIRNADNANTQDATSAAEDAKKARELMKRRKSKRKHIRAPETASEATDPGSNPRTDTIAKGIYMAMMRSELEATSTTTTLLDQTPPTVHGAKRRRMQSPSSMLDTDMQEVDEDNEETKVNESKQEGKQAEVVADAHVQPNTPSALPTPSDLVGVTTTTRAMETAAVTNNRSTNASTDATTDAIISNTTTIHATPFDATNTDAVTTDASTTGTTTTDATPIDATTTDATLTDGTTTVENGGVQRRRALRPSSSTSYVDHNILTTHKTKVPGNADCEVGVSKANASRAIAQANKRAVAAEAKLKLAEQRAALLESKLATVSELVRLLSQAAKNEDA